MFSGKFYLFAARSFSLLAVLASMFLCPTFGVAQPIEANTAPVEDYAISEGGVDMRTGEFQYTNMDLEIGGKKGVQVVRNPGSWNYRYWKPMGNFSHSWHIFLLEQPVTERIENPTFGTIRYSIESTFVVTGFRESAFQRVTNTSNFSAFSYRTKSHLRAIPIDGGDRYWIYTATDGTKVTFRPDGQSSDGALGRGLSSFASKIEEPDGTVYDLSYDEKTGSNPALLRRVVSNRGYVLIFEYTTTAAGKFVSKICALNLTAIAQPIANACPAGAAAATYTYDSDGFMTGYTDPSGILTQYSNTFDQAAWEANFNGYEYSVNYFYPGHSSPYLAVRKFRTWAYEYVKRQDFSDGRYYEYDDWNVMEQGETTFEVAGGNWKRNDGATSSVRYQEMYPPNYVYGVGKLVSILPAEVIDELGRKHTAYYCDPYPVPPGGCDSVPAVYEVGPEGERTEFTRDIYGNATETIQKAKPGSNLPDIVTKSTFNCNTIILCHKPLTVTNGKGNVTTFTYDPTHGGVLTKVGPADANGVRPSTKYTYAQRYAWIKNASGGYSQASSPIWVLTEERSCHSTSMNIVAGTCGGGAADLVVTTYDYGPNSGPNNLWLRGEVLTADGQSLRTCYSYDTYGRKVSETKPNANLISCP